jgi:peptidoglycan/xylan/chitin deacetylase (PgdA/CDA1 family)
MARPATIALALGAAVLVGVGVVVLAEDPQQAVPLAVVNPPTPSATATPPPADPAANPSASEGAPATPAAGITPVAPEVIANGPRDVPRVALTFDTAYSAETAALVGAGAIGPQYNAAVLDYLDATKTPATVFVTGLWGEQYPEAMKRLAATDTIEIGNHTWSHAGWAGDCYGLPSPGDFANQKLEIGRTAMMIAAYTGSAPNLIRFPALCHDAADVALAAEFGEYTVDSDIDLNDTGVGDTAPVVAGILERVQPGSIILLHLNGAPNTPATLEILSQLVPGLQEKGLAPVTVSELIAPVAPTP